MNTTASPTRPALNYYGSKFNLAPWVISHFPDHLNYIEPYMGACSVLLQKPRSKLETVNDLDGNVVNFFRVLRDRPDEPIKKIRLTPWARSEHEFCSQETKVDDLVEWARRFYTICWQSIAGGPSVNGNWRRNRNVAKSGQVCGSGHWQTLQAIADRLENVQIESKDALGLIKTCDNKESLFYVDPPYLDITRSSPQQYTHDFSGDEPHIELATQLRACSGYVLVSGYACPLYAELYEAHGWHRVDKEAQTNGAARIESLWLSPRTWAAIDKVEVKQIGMNI